MAEFFSAQPIDLGARYIAQTGPAIADLASSVGMMIAKKKADKDREQMQFQLQEQARQNERDRAITDGAAQYGVAPVYNADGKLNVIATRAATLKAQDAHDRVKAVAGMQDASDFNTQKAATDLGIGGTAPAIASTAGAAMAPGNPYNAPTDIPNNVGLLGTADPASTQATPVATPNAGLAQPLPSQPLARQVFLAKQAADLEKAKKDDQNRTDILAAEKTNQVKAKELDDYRQTTGQEPPPEHLDANGNLNATGLGAIHAVKVNAIKGYVADPSKPGALIPIPGGPADQKAQADALKLKNDQDARTTKQAMLADQNQALLDNIDKALPLVNGWNTGSVMGSDHAWNNLRQGPTDLKATLASIKSGMGVDVLNEMRASSSTGNTGIGRVMQVEFQAFEKARRNLDQSQSADQLKQNLLDLQHHLMTWDSLKNRSEKGGTAPAPVPAAPSVDDLVKKYSQ